MAVHGVVDVAGAVGGGGEVCTTGAAAVSGGRSSWTALGAQLAASTAQATAAPCARNVEICCRLGGDAFMARVQHVPCPRVSWSRPSAAFYAERAEAGGARLPGGARLMTGFFMPPAHGVSCQFWIYAS